MVRCCRRPCGAVSRKRRQPAGRPDLRVVHKGLRTVGQCQAEYVQDDKDGRLQSVRVRAKALRLNTLRLRSTSGHGGQPGFHSCTGHSNDLSSPALPRGPPAVGRRPPAIARSQEL